MESSQLGLNGTYHVFSLKVDYQYTVQKEAWHNVVFLMCPGYNYLTTDGGVYSRNNTIESQDSFMLGGTEAMGMTNSRVLAAALGAAPVKTSTAPAPTGSLTRTVTGMMMTPFSPTSTSTSTSQPTVGQHQLRRLGQTKESMGYLSGTIAFHNPYGYIPAEMFGLLPFQVRTYVHALYKLAILVKFHGLFHNVVNIFLRVTSYC